MKTLQNEMQRSVNVRHNVKANLTCNVAFSFYFWFCSLSNNDVCPRLIALPCFISLVEGFFCSQGLYPERGRVGDTLLLFKTTHPSIRIMFVQGTAVVADALMMKLHPHCIISNRTFSLRHRLNHHHTLKIYSCTFALFLSCLRDLQNKTLCLYDAGKPTCLRSHCLLFKY